MKILQPVEIAYFHLSIIKAANKKRKPLIIYLPRKAIKVVNK